MIEICFVCTGNTCRSIMAERIAKKIAKEKNIGDIKFSSVGIYATGENIADNARIALKRMGYDGRNRKSIKLAKAKPNVLYVTVTNDHKRFVDSKKVLSFEDFSYRISDPYGQSIDVYLKTAKQLEECVKILLGKILNLRGIL